MGISHKSKICLAHGSLANLEGDSRTDCMNGEPLDCTVAVIRYTHTAHGRRLTTARTHTYTYETVRPHVETQRRKPSRAGTRTIRRGSQSARSCIAHLDPCFDPHGGEHHRLSTHPAGKTDSNNARALTGRRIMLHIARDSCIKK